MPPLFMKEISLTLQAADDLAGTEFHCDVHAATLEASPGDVVTYVTLCPDGTYSQSAADTFTLHLIGAQRWSDETDTDGEGLARYLDDHAGEELTFVYQAHGSMAPSALQPAKAGVCIAQHPAYGGERDTWAEFDVSLPINGVPETLTAPPTARDAELAEAVA
jgi:hypothetical protein